MLKGEPLAQSDVLSAVEQVFIDDISVLYSIHTLMHSLILGWYSAGDEQSWFP